VGIVARSRRTRTRRGDVTITEASLLPAILEELKFFNKEEIFVGIKVVDPELAKIAGVLEYGSTKMKIPSRSFIRIGLKRAKSAVKKRIKEGLVKLAEGNETAEEIMEAVGTIGLDKVVKRFETMKKPRLTAVYAGKKGNKKLLVRYGKLKEALTFTISKRGSGGQ
jgi:phage gpG-like protein